MSNLQITFRKATPADAEVTVPLIYSSGPAAFDYIFNRKGQGRAQKFLIHAFRDGAGEFGYKNHTVAEADGKIVAVGTAYDGSTSLQFTVEAARQILSHYGAGGFPVMIRGLRVEGIIQPPKKGVHYIAHLGVDPKLQSRGIGTQLIEHLLQEGRALGRHRAALDVSLINPRAQALYEKMNFKVTAERISQIKEVPSHRRMERDI